MPEPPSTTIGKYQVLELVGEGAMGSVYRALDPVLNRSVAIKVMSDAIARDLTLRDRFMREAQAAGSLQHPNVVTIFDFGEIEGHLYIAMEFVDGIDLEELIARHVPMTMEQRIGVAIDVLLGLSYAHKRGVVHRDIKPANIRITEDGRAKIMDFGVAHLESTKMTATGVMVGTPNYMAPEQVTGEKIGPATDIFSVGAVLYELVGRRKAFTADSLHNVLFQVVSEEPAPLATIAPDAPRGLDAVVRKAMAKDAEKRYRTAQEMANELTAIRATLSPGVSASTLSLGATIAARTAEREAAKPAARHGGRRWTTTQLVTAAAGVTLLVAGAFWASAARRPPAAADTSTAAATPPSVPPRQTAANPDSASVRQQPVSQPKAPDAPAEPVRDRAGERLPRVTAPPGADREMSIVSLVRASAGRARSRALEAGVSALQLAPGDSQLAEADRLARGKHYAEAVAAINGAMATWAEAERAAQRAAAAPPPNPATQRAAADSVASRPPPVVSAPPVAPPAPVSPPPAPPRQELVIASELTALLGEYARAIESRDLAAIRTVYPGISEEQQRGFRSFFATVRGLKATFSVGTVSVDGNTASAPVSGSYDYTDATGKLLHQTLGFRATFRRDGTRWRISSTR
jgi:serine/threonine-protein kinase